MSTSEASPSPASNDGGRDVELEQIREALRGLQYGSVNVIVQDGVVVQIDRLEKRRLRRSNGGKEE